MQAAYLLDNPIIPYAWGSYTALAELLGNPRPSAEPQAELWLGAHPKAPSMVTENAVPRGLDLLIAEAPDRMLGSAVAASHAGRLPFLLKVLAAREPLSIQAHPSLAQAREGFARENREGIPLDAPERNYRDDNHKPELICALTPFWALCGFRSPDQIARLLSRACGNSLGPLVDRLQSGSEKAPLKVFLEGLLSLSASGRHRVLEETIEFCLATREDAAHWRWIPRLAQAYPGDIGALAPLFLNLVCLQPGEALFLPAGEMHAYLEGTGIEIMANSDNVLRGGLTPKHVDLPELLAVLNFAPYPLNVMTVREIGAGITAFDALCPEFQLHILYPGQTASGSAGGTEGGAEGGIELASVGPEILLCTAGETEIKCGAAGTPLTLKKGAGIFIPAATETYRLRGEGCVYRATVPQTVHLPRK